jgi:uncharacterized protein (TIGR02145 family)
MQKNIFIALFSLLTIYTLIFISCVKEEFILDETFIEEPVPEEATIQSLIEVMEYDVSKLTSGSRLISLGETVFFRDISENFATCWHWDFGDGYTSNKQNPIHTYKSADVFTVSLIASNSMSSDTIIATDFITTVRDNDDKPYKTENRIPAYRSVNQSINSILQWYGSDPNDYKLTYNVYLDTIDGSTLVSESQTGNSFEAINLKYNTTYYWKIVSENSFNYKDTGYVWSFKTKYYCFDIDGNEYNSNKIGDQVWMTENLRTTRYADSTPINLITESTAWEAENYNKNYCWYDDDEIKFAKKYGALYSGAAAINLDNNESDVCPDGWHLPTDDEWKELETFLGMSKDDASRMLYRGTNQGSRLASEAAEWDQYYAFYLLLSSSEFGSTGFNAIPGGYFEGYYTDYQYASYFWSSSYYRESEKLLFRSIRAHSSGVFRSHANLSRSMPVRCIMDE